MKERLPIIVATAAMAVAVIVGVIIIVTTVVNNRPEPAPEPVPAPGETVTEPAHDEKTYFYENLPLYEYDDFKFSNDGNLITYSDENFIGVAGIDVSNHNGDIDWHKVAESGVEFAIISVGYRGYTEGGLNEDESFAENIAGAAAAGLDVGVYFFSQAVSVTEAVEEAEFVLECIEGYDIAYPVVFDWETVASENARTNSVNRLTATNCAIAFCDKIKEAGYTPMVYFNKTSALVNFDLERLTGYDFWLASYSYLPGFDYHFQMWQYSCTGKIPGIGKEVDLNIMFVPA